MKSHLEYKAVVYWANIVKRRESYCLNTGFFSTANIFLTRESAVPLIRRAIPAGSLRALQATSQPPCRCRLNLDGRLEDMLCAIWNAPATRGALRTLLVAAAERWLAAAETEGLEPVSNPPPPEQEIDQCIAAGLLVPPGPCTLPEEHDALVKAATSPAGPLKLKSMI